MGPQSQCLQSTTEVHHRRTSLSYRRSQLQPFARSTTVYSITSADFKFWPLFVVCSYHTSPHRHVCPLTTPDLGRSSGYSRSTTLVSRPRSSTFVFGSRSIWLFVDEDWARFEKVSAELLLVVWAANCSKAQVKLLSDTVVVGQVSRKLLSAISWTAIPEVVPK